MASISGIKVTVKKIKDIIDQSHYTQLNNELKNVIEQSTALDEYINLLTISKLYLSNVKDVVNQLYSFTGDNSAFKAKVAQLSSNKTFEYDVIPENSTKQKKVITYTYFDTFSFDIILSVLRAVSLAQQTENSQFFLPISSGSVNQIAQNVTTNYVAAILQERVEIDRHLKNIKSNASKLTQNTTSTSSIKDVDDYIEKWKNKYTTHKFAYEIPDLNVNGINLFDINEEIELNKIFEKKKNYKTKVQKVINVYNALLVYINKNRSSILTNLNEASLDLDVSYLKEQKDNLTQLLKIAKSSSTETKVNDTESQTATEKSTTPPQTTPTTDKPTAAIPNTSLPLTPDTWGIKFTIAGATTEPKLGKKDPFSPLFGPNAEVSVPQNTYFMDLLPARQSTIPVQGGRDVPNAMPGLNYKLITQVGKQAIPGFSPVYQNLGIKGMQVTIVGAFTGGDGARQLTDTPEPNSKTPFWSNAKGSPSLSDNPDRGGKLSELTAYNSYTEFVQLCQQGKHMEVEINLFQVYNQSTHTQIGQDIKLQSKNGNPKFTGIVRSLDVYHATKERTWYTLIMDVTDFGMASKKAINLNNKLEEAIKKAQAELEAAQAAEAAKKAQSADTTPLENTPTTESNTERAITKIKSLKDKVEATKDEGQIAAYNHMLRVLNYIENSRYYVFGNYLKGFTGISLVDYAAKSLVNLGKYDDIKFYQKDSNTLIVSARIECTYAPIVNITTKCVYHFYWKLDYSSTNKVITRYWKDNFDETEAGEVIGDLLKDGPLYKIWSFETRKGKSLNPRYLNGTKFNDNARGSKAEWDALLKGIVGWDGNSALLWLSHSGGCLVGTGIVAGIATVVATPAGGLAVLASGAKLCGLAAIGEGIQLTQEFNKDAAKKPQEFFEEFIAASLMGAFSQLGSASLGGLGSALKGQGFKAGFSAGLGVKQGSTVKGGTSNSIINSTIDVADDIANILKPLSNDQVLGKVVQSEGVEYTIISLNRTPGLRNVESLLVKDGNGKIKTLNLNQIEALDISLGGNLPKVTTNPTNSTSATQSQAAGSTVSRLTKEIDDLKLADNITKEIKSLTPENQRKVLTVIKTKKANPTKSFTISREGQPDLLVNPEDTFSISSSGFVVRKGSVVYDIPYLEVTGSKIVKTTVTKPPVKPQPIASLDVAITNLPTKYADNAAKAAIKSLEETQQKKIINLIKDIEANGLDNIEFSIKNSKVQTKVNSIKVTANGDIEITTSSTSLPVNPLDLSYKKAATSTPKPKPPTSVPEKQSTPLSSTPEVSQPNPIQPSVPVPPSLTSYSDVGLYTELSSYFGKQIGNNTPSSLKLKLNSGKVYNVQQLDFDSTRNEYIVKYYSYGGSSKSGVDRIKSNAIRTAIDGTGNYITKVYTLTDGAGSSALLDQLEFFKLSKNEEVALLLNSNTKETVLMENAQILLRKDVAFIPGNNNTILNYKLSYKFSTGEIIKVDIYNAEYSGVFKTIKSNFPNFREIPAPINATTLASGHSRIITNKADMVTYLQNLPEGTLIPFNFLENPGLYKLMNFNEWSANPPNIFFKLKKLDSSNYVVEFADEKLRMGGNKVVLPLENLVKFINGFSAN